MSLKQDSESRAALKGEAQAEMVPSQASSELQLEMMELLKKQILAYTGGDSTSVRTETAERLLLSVNYCLDAFCACLEKTGSCRENPEKYSIEEGFRRGRAIVEQELQDCREKFGKLLDGRFPTGLTAYNDTLDHALPEFFSSYDTAFFAHESMAGIDYPLAHDDQKLAGVFYIKDYLEKLELENTFCRRFSHREVEGLLHDFGSTYRIDYRDCLVNIFDLVLTNGVAAVMLGKAPGSLLLTRKETERLSASLAGRRSGVIRVLSGQAQRKLISGLGIDCPQLLAYAHRSEKEIGSALYRALQMKQLDKLVIGSARPAQGVSLRLQPGPKMEDEEFRRLVQALLDSGDTRARVSMILEKICSLEDFVDLLKAECLGRDDFQGLFASLGVLEMGLLTGIAFQEEWRDSRCGWQDMLSSLSLEAGGWQGELAAYCQKNGVQPEWAGGKAGSAGPAPGWTRSSK